MADDPRLSALLRRWQEARGVGAPVEPEELCRDCPELAGELRRLIGATVSPRMTTPDVPTRAAATPDSGLGQLGGFKLVRVLGEGGMGVVYEGEDLALHRRVAIKTLRPELIDDAFRARFLREARSTAALKHDHIVTIFQVGQEGDTPFLVMEFLQGETLQTRLERQGWLPVHEAVHIARQVAQGLAAAHAQGLIHRDIKPANIWLETPLDRVKLLDFGLARAAQSSGNPQLTAHGHIVGTPGYMAPEQIFGGPLDARTDLYALGCVLFQMVTGKIPHEGADTRQMLEAAATHDAPDLAQTPARVPRPVAELLKQLLARDPQERPMSAEIVAARLKTLERSSLALPHGALPELTAPPPRRHTGFGVWGGALIIVLAAVAGVVGAYYRWFGGSDKALIPTGPPIRIGVLHSLTGTFQGSERPMVEAIQLAVEEINKQDGGVEINKHGGGALRRKIEIVLADGHSDEHEFGRLAEKLIVEDKVSAIFGGWSSSARKRVAAVAEKHNHLFIHSTVYEGLEESPNTIYVGGAPNQQLLPAARWAYAELHKRRFFLIGSDYLYSRACNQILRDALEKLSAEAVVGEEYVPLEGTAFAPIVEKAKQAKADIIFSTVDGSSNLALFQALRAKRVHPDDIPTVWFSLGDADMASLRLKEMVGDYAVGAYFQTLKSQQNEDFLGRLKEYANSWARIGDAAEASYLAVYLWKQAVETAGAPEPLLVRDAFGGQWVDGPEGKVTIDEKNLHAWRMARFARLNAKLEFEILYSSAEPLRPEPFPPTRSRAEWKRYVKKLYDDWGGHWEAPRH
jgi:urea transport system substrate-binding protein